MAWLSDEEYAYRQDCKEKRSVAASAFKQRTHCGKGGSVRFPHDNLTKKELRAMNGECVEYRMNEPITWDNFKAMPDNLKAMYVNNLREKFGASDKYIAEMMGVHPVTFGKFIRCLGLGKGSHGAGVKKKWDVDAFLAWTRGEDPDAVNGITEVSEVADEDPCENASVTALEGVEAENCVPVESKDGGNSQGCDGCKRPERAIPEAGSLTFEAPANQALEMLRMLLGETKVTLNVQWTIVQEE